MALTTDVQTTPIMLGSGELYIAKCSDLSSLSAPTDEDLAKFVNIGAISGNATLSIKDDDKDVESTNRGVVDVYHGKRTVSFKTGIITFNLENLANFIYGGDYTDDTTNKKQTVSIGSETAGKCYLKFIHTDKETGNTLTVNIYQSIFSGEQSFEFGEDATSTNYEFKALATTIDGKTKYFNIEYDYSGSAN